MLWIIVGTLIVFVSIFVAVCFGRAARLGELSDDDLRAADEWIERKEAS